MGIFKKVLHTTPLQCKIMIYCVLQGAISVMPLHPHYTTLHPLLNFEKVSQHNYQFFASSTKKGSAYLLCPKRGVVWCSVGVVVSHTLHRGNKLTHRHLTTVWCSVKQKRETMHLHNTSPHTSPCSISAPARATYCLSQGNILPWLGKNWNYARQNFEEAQHKSVYRWLFIIMWKC